MGGKLSQADIFLYHLAKWAFAPNAWGPGNAAACALIAASPKVAKIVAAVAAIPAIAAWEEARTSKGEAF